MWNRTRPEKAQKVGSECFTKTVPFIRQDKYFLQVNELYRVEDEKLRVNDSNVVGENQVQYSSEISWKKEKKMVWRCYSNCQKSKDGSKFRAT